MKCKKDWLVALAMIVFILVTGILVSGKVDAINIEARICSEAERVRQLKLDGLAAADALRNANSLESIATAKKIAKRIMTDMGRSLNSPHAEDLAEVADELVVAYARAERNELYLAYEATQFCRRPRT